MATSEHVFHIRRPLRRRGGNQFYKDRSERKVSTYCGADVTDYDVPHTSKAEKWNGHVPCGACIIARAKERGRS